MAKQQGKLFGVPISGGVAAQLDVRQRLKAQKNRNAQEVMLLANQGAWVRMCSGVNVVPEGTNLQKNYDRLSNPAEGVTSSEGGAGYNQQDIDKELVVSQLKTQGSEPARQNILHGGTMSTAVNRGTNEKGEKTVSFVAGRRSGFNPMQTNADEEKAFSYDQEVYYGYRPMAGIKDFKVKSKSTYGSLKEIEVNIQANTQQQLSDIEMLYLRPGYDMLIEWGNSAYKINSGDIITDTTSVFKKFLSGKSPQIINDEIKKQKEDSSYNYDAIIGKVINFSWSYTPEGTYDISVKLMTRGEIMESLSSNQYSSSNDKLKDISKKNSTAGGQDVDETDRLSLILNSLMYVGDQANKDKTLGQFRKDFLKNAPDGTHRVYRTNIKTGETQSEDNKENKNSKAYAWFMPLGDFLNVLNEAFIANISKEDDTEKVVKFGVDYSEAQYGWFPQLFSSNLNVCAVPAVLGKGSNGFYLYERPKQYTVNDDGSPKYSVAPTRGYSMEDVLSRPYINKVNNRIKEALDAKKKYYDEDVQLKLSPLSIFVNLEHMLKKQQAFLEDKKENLSKEQALYTYIKSALDDISSCLGGTSLLDLQLDNDTSRWIVVDRNLFGPSPDQEPLPRIEVAGPATTVSNFGLSSKISNAIATQLAIGASASGVTQIKQETLLRHNKDLINRYDFHPPLGNRPTIIDIDEELARVIKKVFKLYGDYASYGKNDESKFKDLAFGHREFAEIMYQRYRKTKGENGKEHFPGLLPIDLNLELDGISGLKVGESFTVTPEILPTRYVNKVAFVITQIEHSFDNNRWVTDLTCKMFNLPAMAVLTEEENAKRDYASRSDDKNINNNRGGWLTPTKVPWSAAFISHVVKKGYPGFPVSDNHAKYAQALRSDNNWEILNAKTTKPKVGDLLLYSRNGNPIKFTDTLYKGSTHTDIVISVNGSVYEIIGGNVSQTVKKKKQQAERGFYPSFNVLVMRPKSSAVNIQTYINEAKIEWNYWHPGTEDKQNQYSYRETTANLEGSLGDKYLKKLDQYWASVGLGGQIKKDLV